MVEAHLLEVNIRGCVMEAVLSPAPLAGEHHDWGTCGWNLHWTSAMVVCAETHRSKLAANRPLTIEDGLVLYHHPDLNEVGALADVVRQARFDSKAFFNSNVHINQTNICVLACRFCAFRRP